MIVSIGNLPLKNIEADVFLHPIRVKESITYEPLAEEAVIALIAKYFTYDFVPEEIREYFDEMDDGYLFSESNFDEFDLDKLKNAKVFLIGKDIYLHPRLTNIKKFLTILKDFGGIEIKGIELPYYFTPADSELAEIVETEKRIVLDEIEELDSFDGSVVYFCDDFEIVKENELIASNQFVIANKIKSLKVKVDNSIKELKKLQELKGTFGIVYGRCDDYPFKRVKIESI
jgi:hypothetical protein